MNRIVCKLIEKLWWKRPNPNLKNSILLQTYLPLTQWVLKRGCPMPLYLVKKNMSEKKIVKSFWRNSKRKIETQKIEQEQELTGCHQFIQSLSFLLFHNIILLICWNIFQRSIFEESKTNENLDQTLHSLILTNLLPQINLRIMPLTAYMSILYEGYLCSLSNWKIGNIETRTLLHNAWMTTRHLFNI